MSFFGSTALQAAVYDRLSNDTVMVSLVGSDIYDVLPSGTIPDIYVTIGDERVKDASDSTGDAVRVEFDVSVVSRSGGFQAAKSTGYAIINALVSTPMTLTQGHLAGLWFLKTTAKRTGDPEVRRLDLTFKGFVQDSL